MAPVWNNRLTLPLILELLRPSWNSRNAACYCTLNVYFFIQRKLNKRRSVLLAHYYAPQTPLVLVSCVRMAQLVRQWTHRSVQGIPDLQRGGERPVCNLKVNITALFEQISPKCATRTPQVSLFIRTLYHCLQIFCTALFADIHYCWINWPLSINITFQTHDATEK